MRYLALGDSYTIGEGAAEDERWPVLLADALRKRGYDISTPEIVARTGWTAAELLVGIEDAGIKPGYDLVSLLIGVNDQYRGNDPEDFRTDLRRCLALAGQLAHDDLSRVVVVSIPDWGVTPFANERDRRVVALEIDLFNRIVQSECESAGASWVDITPLSRRYGAEDEMLVSDGLHPSGKMYASWITEIIPPAEHIMDTHK